MKILMFIFIKVPNRIYRFIFYKWEYLYYKFFYTKPELNAKFLHYRYLLCDGDNSDDIANNFHNLFPDKVQEKIAQADSICEHIFDLLGSGPKKLSQEGKSYQAIDWHVDFKSGHRWDPKSFYKQIRYGHKEGVDIKVPWELSRFQHLTILGQAYLLTKNKKYADEFVNEITDWIESNQIGFGVNWFCPMDIAIRAANWLVAAEYFHDNPEIPDTFWNSFYLSIYEHGKFIRGNLEYSPVLTTNHYIADIAGLFFIAVYCPFFKESSAWMEFAFDELVKEMQKQVYQDGCNFEASTSYHRLVLEMFFYSELLGKKAGLNFPYSYHERLKKMFEFSLYCIKPNGNIPQIGDNDNGRFLIFNKRSILEHKYLLSLAAIYYKDSQFKLPEFAFDEEAFWLFGSKGRELYDNLIVREEPITSKSFPDAGWFIMRHNDNYCFVSCGSNGQNGRGGHSHNDKLSFELAINGQDVIVDPGTYVYTPYPEKRNKFRSTAYHNTAKFNGCEQNKISERNLFVLTNRVKIKNVTLNETESDIKFEGEIQYLDFIHKRTIILNKNKNNWQIIDMISCPKPTSAKLIFHLSPNITFDGNNILMNEMRDKIASIEVKGHNLEKGIYDYSSKYGMKEEAGYQLTLSSLKETTQSITTYIKRAQ